MVGIIVEGDKKPKISDIVEQVERHTSDVVGASGMGRDGWNNEYTGTEEPGDWGGIRVKVKSIGGKVQSMKITVPERSGE